LLSWEAPHTEGSKPIDPKTRKDMRDAIMDVLDELFDCHDAAR
jgi:hypothetical protein